MKVREEAYASARVDYLLRTKSAMQGVWLAMRESRRAWKKRKG